MGIIYKRRRCSTDVANVGGCAVDYRVDNKAVRWRLKYWWVYHRLEETKLFHTSAKPALRSSYVFCICIATNRYQKQKSVEFGDQQPAIHPGSASRRPSRIMSSLCWGDCHEDEIVSVMMRLGLFWKEDLKTRVSRRLPQRGRCWWWRCTPNLELKIFLFCKIKCITFSWLNTWTPNWRIKNISNTLVQYVHMMDINPTRLIS